MVMSEPAHEVGAAIAAIDQLVADQVEYSNALLRAQADVRNGKPVEVALAAVPAGPPATPAALKGLGGRPARATTHADLAAQAPIPEAVTLPAHKVGRWLRENVTDPGLLRRGHRFEVRHGRRKSVLREFETRLRLMREPLGGPADAPWPGYDRDTPEEIERELRRRPQPELAATVYAWEHYRRARPQVLAAAKALAPATAADLVAATAPLNLPDLDLPWEGYDTLRATAGGRAALSEALSSASKDDLLAARRYEEQTKARTIMLAAIDSALSARRRDRPA